MATVNGFTAEKMQEIADETVVDGHLDNGTFILTARDGTEIVVGYVKGDKGDPGDNALPVELSSGGNPATSGEIKYLRVAVVDGLNDLNGAQVIFDYNGGSNYGESNVYSAKVHVGQRGTDNIQVEVFENGVLNTKVEWFTRRISNFVFEVWVKIPLYAGPIQLQPLVEWHGSVVFDSVSTTAPSNLVPASIISERRVVKALLDPSYIGPGPATVKFLPDMTPSSSAYQWVGEYKPWGNRVVNLERRNGTWVILGHSAEEDYGGKVAISLQNGWISYNDRNGISSNRWSPARYQKLVSGIVVLSGLIGYGTSTSNTVLFTLPPGYRPDTNMIFPINNGDNAKSISIMANGNVQARGSWVANTYISLDGIAFPAAGVADWISVGAAGSGSSYANGWVGYADPTWGGAKYWKDPYGFVWFTGLISSGTTGTDNLTMINLPAGYRQHLQSHSKVANQDAHGFVSALTEGGIGWKNGSTGNSWLSLSGLVIVTSDAVNNNPWNYLGMVNGWTRYSGAFPAPAILRREDGLGMAMGLLKGGTAPAIKLANLPLYAAPLGSAILYGVSGTLFNRIDLYSKDWSADDDRGAFRAQTGATSWVSWDSQMWMIGD